MSGGEGDRSPGAVLFEFAQIGQQMRVVAIDEASGIEVVAIAPLTANRNQMQALALAKLRRRLALEAAPPPAPPRGKFA